MDPAKESVGLTNYSTVPADIGGYSLTDGEGTAVLPAYVLGPGCTVFMVRGPADGNGGNEVQYPAEGKKGNLTLANSGDEVMLFDAGGTRVDTVCYGTSAGADGWTGGPAPVGQGKHLVRISGTDTDTSADWKLTKDGWTLLPSDPPAYGATVTPFTFPESCGIPVLRALSSAEKEVLVCIYLLSDMTACGVLADLASRGVDVRILFEGSPLGVNTNREIQMLKTVSDGGADIRVINGAEHTRYSYVHAKYAVIDGCRTVVTSENWTEGNIGT